MDNDAVDYLVISTPGLNPSNNVADGFPNLARSENPPPEIVAEVTATAKAELEAAGIKALVFAGVRGRNEVPNDAVGVLSMWNFTRRWYYWSAEGPGLPVEVAERLHATHGTQVRVAGHCDCPSPREWYKGFGVGNYHIDTPAGLKALADALRSVYDESKV